MRYVHTEDDQVRCAADLVATRRRALLANVPASSALAADGQLLSRKP
jgi:hypothetical protein